MWLIFHEKRKKRVACVGGGGGGLTRDKWDHACEKQTHTFAKKNENETKPTRCK